MKELEKYLKHQCLTPEHKYILNVFCDSKVQTFGDEDFVYYLASCSKTILGAISLKILKEDCESVLENFNTYLVELKVSSELSIYDFLGHATNAEDYLNHYDVNHGKTVSDVLDEFVLNQNIKKIGYRYSNTNYVILYDFLEKYYNFQTLMDDLNNDIRENFKLLNREIVNSVPNLQIKGELNQVFADGSIIFNPKDLNKDKSSFMIYFYKMIEQDLNFFIKHSISVDEHTLYGFGCFYCKKTGKIYHSGFFNNNIAYWEIGPGYKGVFFCTNFAGIEQEKINQLLK